MITSTKQTTETTSRFNEWAELIGWRHKVKRSKMKTVKEEFLVTRKGIAQKLFHSVVQKNERKSQTIFIHLN